MKKSAANNFSKFVYHPAIHISTNTFPLPSIPTSLPQIPGKLLSMSAVLYGLESKPGEDICNHIGCNGHKGIFNYQNASLSCCIIYHQSSMGKNVELTLWGDFCNEEGQKLQEIVDSGFFPVLAVEAGKVNDFNGKSVGTISSTQLLIDPDCPEAQGLRDWFERGGRNTASISISMEIMPGGSNPKTRYVKPCLRSRMKVLEDRISQIGAQQRQL